MEKRFDVIIFGATGYTGKYAIRNAIEILKGMQWAIAGRNKSKLEETLRDSGRKMNEDLSKIPIIIADVADEISVQEMAKQAKVIVNCCGPYHLFGEVVVKACVENETSHVDVSGEAQFIEKIMLKYGDAAREKGVYIISCCGIESIPAELGVFYAQQQFNGTINSVETYMRFYFEKGFRPTGPSLNYGTYHSAIHAIGAFLESQKLRKLLYPKPMPSFQPKLKNRFVHCEEAVRNRWCLPMIEPDQTMVNRTQRYFFEKEGLRPIQMNAYMVFGNFFQVLAILIFIPLLLLLAQFEFGRNILLEYPRVFFAGMTSHEGPPEETVEKSLFEMIFITRGWREKSENLNKPTNKKVITRVHARNPAYGATSAALLLSATTIIREGSKMPNGGVLTPGIAFRNTNMIDELQKHGITFSVESVEE